MADLEKGRFGASVLPVTPHNQPAQNAFLKPEATPEVPSSPASLTSSFDAKPPNAFSPFYNHPPCSFEQATKSNSKSQVGIYQHDVESYAALAASRISIEPTRDCAMWPSQKELKRRAKANKKRSCTRIPKCSKRAKVILSVVLFIMVIGIALVLGFVVSKKVGGGIYVSASAPNKPVR